MRAVSMLTLQEVSRAHTTLRRELTVDARNHTHTSVMILLSVVLVYLLFTTVDARSHHRDDSDDSFSDSDSDSATPSPTPRNTTGDACSSGACTVSEPITVSALNAESLKVACKPVCGGDGDLTTLEQYSAELGQCVSQIIPGACTNDAQCAQFRPSPASCHMSMCDTTNHICQHTRIPGCCTSDEQCPERECYERQCNCPAVGQALMKLDARTGDLRFHKLATSDCSQQQCAYTARKNCCLRSTSTDAHDLFACNNMRVCSPLETPICDYSSQCQCVKQIEIECTTDDDCNAAPLNATTTTSRTTTGTTSTTSTTTSTTTTIPAPTTTSAAGGRKRQVATTASSRNRPTPTPDLDESESASDDDDDEGSRREPFRSADRCARLKCSRARICVPSDDDGFDGDGDGVPCTEDCDDTNGTVRAFIYCARAGTAAQPNKFNLDNDSCIDCGAPVDRLCAASCPATVPNLALTLRNGTSVNVSVSYFQVNESALCESPRRHESHGHSRFDRDDSRELHVCFDCDCCHTNPGGCDVPSTCGINGDNDPFPLCGTVQPACVLQTPRNRTRDDESSSSRSRSRSGSRRRFDDEGSDSGSLFDFNERSSSGSDDSGFDDFSDENSGSSNSSAEFNETAAADAACVAFAEEFNLPNASRFVFIPESEIGNCENCEEIAGKKELADQTCYLDTDGDGHVQCPFDDNFKDCCKTILHYNKTDSDLEVEPTVLSCCKNQNSNHTGCKHPNDKPPIIVNQCKCSPPYIIGPDNHVDECPLNSHGFEMIQCFPDRDGDGAADCDHPVKVCFKFETDDADKACKSDRSAGMPLVAVDLDKTPKEENAKCDCDDNNCQERQFVTCLPDHDHDGFPACKCERRCGHCDGDQLPFDFSAKGQDRKRSVLAAAHILNNGGHAHDRDDHRRHRFGDDSSSSDEISLHIKSGSDEDDDDEGSERSAGCPAPLEHPLAHEKCPTNTTTAAIEKLIHSKNATFKCDCCDRDPRAFPGSLWASKTRVRCAVDNDTLFASNDFNCNGANGLVVACDHKNVTRVGDDFFRQIGQPDVFSINNTDFLGSCTVHHHNCTLKPGFTLEAEGAHHEKLLRKRRLNEDSAGDADSENAENDQNAASHHKNSHHNADTAPECRKAEMVTIRHVNTTTTLLSLMDIGDCADFVSGCTYLDGKCYQDCDVCVLIAH